MATSEITITTAPATRMTKRGLSLDSSLLTDPSHPIYPEPVKARRIERGLHSHDSWFVNREGNLSHNGQYYPVSLSCPRLELIE